MSNPGIASPRFFRSWPPRILGWTALPVTRLRPHHALIVLLAAHLSWVAARVPHAVVMKRLGEVDTFRSRGDVAHFLDNHLFRGADVVAWARANTEVDAIVLFDGEQKGALEFVPALLFPRLLVAAGAVARGQTDYCGRPIAVASREGRTGHVVLVGRGDRVELELR